MSRYSDLDLVIAGHCDNETEKEQLVREITDIERGFISYYQASDRAKRILDEYYSELESTPLFSDEDINEWEGEY